MKNLKPDFVHIEKDMSDHNSLYCSFITELLVAEKIDNEHRGKIITYLETLLDLDPWREFAIGLVTNLKDFEIMKGKK